jgi:transposase-like protein
MKLSTSEFELLKSHQFCDNPDCSCYQKTNAGNMKIYSKKQGQIYCNVCKSRPFVVTKGTIFYWLKKPLELVVSTLMLLARGMGLNNTCAHQGVTADSVLVWIEKAGNHAEEFTDFMVQNMELDQVQIDEFWSFIQKKRKANATRTKATRTK